MSPLGAPVAVVDAIRSLERPGACTVLCGQQPGLFGGPLLSLTKALQAARLAQRLSAAWEVPVVPVFWNHADDHDIAEVHHSHFVNPSLDLQRVGLAGMSSGRQPLSRIVLTEEHQHLEAVYHLLEQSFHDTPHVAEALDVCMPRAGDSFAQAFTRTLTTLVGHLGVVVLEPDWIRPWLSRALARTVDSDPQRALAAGAERVRAQGYDVAIEPADAALVYHLIDGSRYALRTGGEGFRYDGEAGSRTTSELAAEIVQAPADYSAGALLRPIVQDLALPVCAYVGGTGEVLYHAGLAELREQVDAPQTPWIPRISCTLTDPDVRFALDRMQLTVGEVLRARGVESPIPEAPPIVHQLRAVAEYAAAELGALRTELVDLDETLAVNLKRARSELRAVIDKLVQKAERVHANRSGIGRRHDRRVNNTLFPDDRPQERVLGPLEYVARHGREWIDELYAELDPLGTEHLVVHLGGDAEGEPGDDG